jgi:succinoglycan biosynthesis protein ExoA
MRPFLSVIIPCRNEAPFIAPCLNSILASDYPRDRMEVLVADGLSVDGTLPLLQVIAARDPRLRLLDNPERITPVALNRAIAAARGEIVIRFDAHAVMPPDYLSRCVDLLEHSGADNAGGAIRTVAQSNGPFSAPIAAALGSRFGVGNSRFRTASKNTSARPSDTVFGGCWRREIFSRLGGFNERLARGQDLEFNLRLLRAGGTILLDPSIVCDYYARSSLASFWKHNFTNGAWAILPFALSGVVPVRPRHLVPLAFVLALAGSFLLPFPWSIAVPSVYAALNLAVSAQLAFADRRLRDLALLPIVFAALHLAYGLGSAWGCLRLCAQKLTALPKGTHAIRSHLKKT